MSAADDAHDQAGLLGVVLEGDHDASAFLQRFVFCLVDLEEKPDGGITATFLTIT